MHKFICGLLAVSLIANATYATAYHLLWHEYERLLTWACEHGNGGADCGEE